MPRKPKAQKQVESIHHKDKRTNIPTEELRDFVAEDEKAPETMLYPRDPSLDPQLVWKGKDEQDQQDLEVPIVPIYIQEKIHPKAIIDDLPRKVNQHDRQSDLFADFNGIDDFEKRVDFYHHEANWANRMILGDSLLVMTSLAEKEGLKGKVQTIYIDPPYGIRFGSNWQVSTRKRDVKDSRTEDVTRQPEQIRAFRDTWELGIHSYLAYLRDRLVVAKDLLTDTGSVFVQIGEENVHLVRAILDEVFGSENCCSLITFVKTSVFSTELLSRSYDYLLWYAKNKEQVKYRCLWQRRQERTEGGTYNWIEDEKGKCRRLTAGELRGEIDSPPGRRFRADTVVGQGATATGSKPVTYSGREYLPSPNSHWKTTWEGMNALISASRVTNVGKVLAYKRYEDDFPFMPFTNVWDDTIVGTFSEKIYVVQTGVRVVGRCLLMTTDSGDLVLDPTCGSGTAAYVAEQWGRRWITIDTSRVALALARTRLMGAKYPYYHLADSPEGVQKEAEVTGKVPPPYKTEGDIRKGFVYKRVPHITLKYIANNPDIKEGMSREEIDKAIARSADQEILYDQPYEDNKTVRVTGPFTVESISPHRVLAADAELPATEKDGRRDSHEGQFETMIIENLRKAGVQNTIKNERLKFDHLEPFGGTWIHAAGEYTDADGKPRRAAVSIGPEHGTVGPQHVKEAAKEAVQGVGYDILIVCGFAFDPHVSEEAKRYGDLTVLPTRMNPDLAMGDELLKKTGAGNLFMVFGEPDVDIRKDKDGKIVLEIKGVDVYDPTTGQIRNSSTDDIACWFIDTDYNEESFFVRHAYFTGAEEPYDKLKRALRAEIDEASWSELYSTVSRPFEKPETGKIAVKVINHYGDEVLKVFDV